jgi:hypothetical protein
MSQTSIPKEAELRNWAARELSAQGVVSLEKMQRLASATLGARSDANAVLTCRRDEQHRYLVDITDRYDGGYAMSALSATLRC